MFAGALAWYVDLGGPVWLLLVLALAPDLRCSRTWPGPASGASATA